MIEQPLFGAPAEPAPKPARYRCEEPGCGRPIWSPASIRAGPDGCRRGAECRRRWLAARRALVIPAEPAWHVPGQLTITEEDP